MPSVFINLSVRFATFWYASLHFGYFLLSFAMFLVRFAKFLLLFPFSKSFTNNLEIEGMDLCCPGPRSSKVPTFDLHFFVRGFAKELFAKLLGGFWKALGSFFLYFGGSFLEVLGSFWWVFEGNISIKKHFFSGCGSFGKFLGEFLVNFWEVFGRCLRVFWEFFFGRFWTVFGRFLEDKFNDN